MRFLFCFERLGKKGMEMNEREAMAYLNDISVRGSVLGLKNMRELLSMLGNPQHSLRFIHIAGTNGKGSVSAYVSSVLSEAGCRTGQYTSPHLFSYYEKYRVNGKDIEEETFAHHLEKVRKAAEEMERSNSLCPTCFEVETATAFLYFAEEKCDVVVMETGLGGISDATNVVETTLVSVLTSIGMDHMNFLGNSLREIAEKKAGIIKEGCTVVSAAQETEAQEVIEREAENRNCPLRIVREDLICPLWFNISEQIFDYGRWKKLKICLAGAYQFKNAALSLEVIEALREKGFCISDRAVYDGMKKTIWRGRFTPISKSPIVILDGAHNEAAAIELKKSIELYLKERNIYFIMGIFRDKEYEKVIRLTAPMAQYIIAVETPGNPRALPAEELKQEIAKVNPSVESAKSIGLAVKRIYEKADAEAAIVIFGSLSFLAEAERVVMERGQAKE